MKQILTHKETTIMLKKLDYITMSAKFILMVIMIGAMSTDNRCLAQSQSQWKIHDMDRPRPPVVTPGKQELPRKPPSDALILFDGNDLSQWSSTKGGPAKWRVVNGYMETVKGSGYIQTKKSFGDIQLHVEWSAPLPAKDEGQDRGNSGVFLMGRYEIQVLDSYENVTYADGQAAAVYGQYPPLVNACRPPGEWQTYDIIFRRPRFDQDGRLLQPARITVLQNGILVQDNVELWGPIAWLEYETYKAHLEKLPLSLQDHDSPVRFRNIWVRELSEHALPGPPSAEVSEAITLAPNVLDRYVGKYETSPGKFYTITREGEQMFAIFYGSRKLEIVAYSERKFSLKRTAGYLDFNLNSDGKVEGCTFHLGGKQYPARRVQK